MPSKGGKCKEENKGFAVFLKTLSQLARSGYLFSCLITGVNWYKIGREKRINKVLLTVRRYTDLISFGTAGN